MSLLINIMFVIRCIQVINANKSLLLSNNSILRSDPFLKQLYQAYSTSSVRLQITVQTVLALGCLSRGVIFLVDPWGEYQAMPPSLQSMLFRFYQVSVLHCLFLLPIRWKNVASTTLKYSRSDQVLRSISLFISVSVILFDSFNIAGGAAANYTMLLCCVAFVTSGIFYSTRLMFKMALTMVPQEFIDASVKKAKLGPPIGNESTGLSSPSSLISNEAKISTASPAKKAKGNQVASVIMNIVAESPRKSPRVLSPSLGAGDLTKTEVISIVGVARTAGGGGDTRAGSAATTGHGGSIKEDTSFDKDTRQMRESIRKLAVEVVLVTFSGTFEVTCIACYIIFSRVNPLLQYTYATLIHIGEYFVWIILTFHVFIPKTKAAAASKKAAVTKTKGRATVIKRQSVSNVPPSSS